MKSKVKEILIAKILAELHAMGKWKVLKGGVIHVETQSTGGTQKDHKTDSRKRRNDSVLIGSKGTSGNTP